MRFRMITDPESSKFAYGLHVFFTIVILVSIVDMCLLSVPHLDQYQWAQLTLFATECFVGVTFFVEMVLRWMGFASWKEILQPMNMIDLLACMPFVLEAAVLGIMGFDFIATSTNEATFALVKIFRLLRVFRLFRLASKSDKIQLMAVALWESREGILALLYVIPLTVIFFATIVYYAEQTGEYYNDGVWYYVADNQISAFQSIPGTFWFILVTLTTVGYGDDTPHTTLGRLATSSALVTSMFLIAFPLTMIQLQYGAAARKWAAGKAARMARIQEERNNEKLAAKVDFTKGNLGQTVRKTGNDMTEFVWADGDHDALVTQADTLGLSVESLGSRDLPHAGAGPGKARGSISGVEQAKSGIHSRMNSLGSAKKTSPSHQAQDSPSALVAKTNVVSPAKTASAVTSVAGTGTLQDNTVLVGPPLDAIQSTNSLAWEVDELQRTGGALSNPDLIRTVGLPKMPSNASLIFVNEQPCNNLELTVTDNASGEDVLSMKLTVRNRTELTRLLKTLARNNFLE
ncbi:voltage-gated potassium channel [Gonapodya prolifera JEL478]|uniref:Voltage-gated potassium channel n=1 Tax=Gonapodya prolifera (strain JEL478) TaxID=1344416 RepID=A0A139A6K7_GONPJ|nr:voltage-gated potassium channel [Gonapodya prolifera JEL478]|eukprot:KXS12289.1 voltage-gated potassium channel [Gonapodya prolifera JEL478]